MKDASDLKGKLLLAMPSIGDPRFHRAVIFIAAHDENGALGLVVNTRLADVHFPDLIEQLGLQSDIQIDLNALELPVMAGGPVEPARGFLLHSTDFSQSDTIPIAKEFSITGTTDALKDVVQGKGPEHALFILGYAGWTPGQLEDEISRNAWLVSEPSAELIFEMDDHLKWERAVQTMGFDPALLSGDAGHA